MITDYNTIYKDINSLLKFLNDLGIDANTKSHLEHDFLIATDFIEKYNQGRQDQLTDEGRIAVCGLHELYKWIWSIRDCEEFKILLPHLKMLSESASRINSKTPMINPVTGKQDDKTNKLIETIVAMFAIKVGSNIDLDDPVASSNGENPDIIFDYSGQRVAIACKTLRGSSPNALLDNLRSAAKQIERATCDRGYVAINAMNILPHEKIVDNVYSELSEPFNLLVSDLVGLYESIQLNAPEELDEIFKDQKVRPVILTFVHSTIRLSSLVGNISTMIKSTFASPLKEITENEFDLELLNQVNEFIHQSM